MRRLRPRIGLVVGAAAAILAAVTASSSLAIYLAVHTVDDDATALLIASTIAAFITCIAVIVTTFAGVSSLRQLDKLMRDRQEQLRVMSHEIRTPLTIIQGSAELLQQGWPDMLDQTQQGFLQAIVSNSRSMHRLAEDLLAQARIEADMFSVRRETVDYRDFIARLVRELREIHQVEVLLNNLRTPLLVSLDPVLLRHVLNNLVGNSARYALHSQVMIRVVRREGGVLTTISDFGPGIDREQLNGKASVHRALPDSNGIGLRVVRSILHLHGGALYLDSALGRGTTASVYLPQ
jgi:two-component system OmpR family sensor kinase